ncbi:MAG: hypothetical protein Q9226_000695 [Calogaya cf. arnoldii]
MGARKLGQMSAQCFDSGTGQVYMERTCKAGSMTSDWTWKSRGSLENLTKWLNHDSPGSSSLRDLSIRKALANIFNLTSDMMETLPLHLTRQLWLETERRGDLIQLSRLTNLGMLAITTKDSSCVSLEDSIVRAWGRAASEAGAFPRFRILFCRLQTPITGKIFGYFQDFPALDLLILDSCGSSNAFVDQAKQNNWHAPEQSNFCREDAAVLSSGSDDLYCGSFKMGDLPGIEAMYKRLVDDETILHVSLGSTTTRANRLLTPSQASSGDVLRFRRKARCSDHSSLAHGCPQKRFLADDSDATSRSLKKPTLRSSRQRTLKKFLADF